MLFFKRLLCGSNSAVNEDAYHRPAGTALFSRLLCGSNSAVDDDAYKRPPGGSALSSVAQQKRAYVLPNELVLFQAADEPVNNKTDMVNFIATETADESETELEDEYYDEEIQDEESVAKAFSFTDLLGKSLVTNYSSELVNSDDALEGSAVVAIYYAAAQRCKETTELLSVFDAGYEYKSLSIVYCSADDQDDGSENAGFDAMPARWWALPASETQVKRALLEKLDIVDRHPCLVVLDPATGNVLSSSTALRDIIDLDPSHDAYDEKAHAIFRDWIVNLALEQHVVGEMEIEFTRGERTEYENTRAAPFNVGA